MKIAKNKKKDKSSEFSGAISLGMTYKQLKKECVRRGMPFTDISNGDYYNLISFLDSDNALRVPDDSLVEKYDEWMVNYLKEHGKEAYFLHPSLRLGYISEGREEVEKKKKPKVEKKERKPKREMNKVGLVVGTKKEYTQQLVEKGFEIDRVIRRVLKKFPDASEKSIRIWFRKFSGLKGVRKVKEKKDRKSMVKKTKTLEEVELARKKAKERRILRKQKRDEANQRSKESLKKSKKKKK